MKTLKKIALAPFSLLYITVVTLRHWLFDRSILRSESFRTPIICIGNITVGGSGKSPMGELLLEHLTKQHTVAILSRGYGRRTKGYREVMVDDSYLDVGDEPLQIKRKYPSVLVVVCEKRAVGIRQIEQIHPEVDVIIMDDGFQHRYVTPTCNIIMVDATRPTFEDLPLPAGELRDTTSSLKRANIFIVTKCPDSMSDLRREEFRCNLLYTPQQSIYFTQIVNSLPQPIYPEIAHQFDKKNEVIALSGIGNPAPFLKTLHTLYTVIEELTYPDHHSYTERDIKKISSTISKHPRSVIITTEKDGVKFLNNNNIPNTIKQKLYHSPIHMKFISGSKSELLKSIDSYVRKD
ncbi:MAG: tetraacyldisaccharide 4'-kinase [Rikenellaceae bacterium]